MQTKLKIKAEERASMNTDKTIWEKKGAGRVFITNQDALGIEVGGYVIVKPLANWHRTINNNTTGKLKIKGKGCYWNHQNDDAEIELDIADLAKQHPELWLGEGEIANTIRSYAYIHECDLGKGGMISESDVCHIAKALVGRIKNG